MRLTGDRGDMKGEVGAEISPRGNPPALLEDSRSLTARGVVEESAFHEPLKAYEKNNNATV